jgi:hypothetical protein
VLSVSEAGYYAWLDRPSSAHAVADLAALKRVRTVQASSRQTDGAPRVHVDLRARGERHGRKRIARLMRQAELIGASRRQGGPTTAQRDQEARPAPDLVGPQLHGASGTAFASRLKPRCLFAYQYNMAIAWTRKYTLGLYRQRPGGDAGKGGDVAAASL